MKQTRKRFLQWRDYTLLRFVMLLASPLSLRALQRLGGWLGLACWHVLPFRRKVVLANLRASCGQQCDESELQDRGRAFYKQLGTTLLEFCGYWRLSPAQILDLVEVSGREHLDATLAMGRGALLVSGHFGNWELLAAWIAATGTQVRFLVKSQSNQRVDSLQNELRRRAGVEVLRVGGTTREMVRILRQGGVIGMLGDQDAGQGGIFLDFLGRPASVFRSAASLAWRLRCPVMTGFLVRLPDGRHRLDITPALVPDPDWDEPTAIATITRWHTERLERMVRRHPDHYFWVHRRWKTQPPPAAS